MFVTTVAHSRHWSENVTDRICSYSGLKECLELFADYKNNRSEESMPSWHVRLCVETYRCVGAWRRHGIPYDSTHWNTLYEYWHAWRILTVHLSSCPLRCVSAVVLYEFHWCSTDSTHSTAQLNTFHTSTQATKAKRDKVWMETMLFVPALTFPGPVLISLYSSMNSRWQIADIS